MPPPNDNIASAQPMAGASGATVSNNVGATVESGEPGIWSSELAKVTTQGNTPVQGAPTCCPRPATASVWYKWDASQVGSAASQSYFFKCDSDFPSVIQVFIAAQDWTVDHEASYIFNESLGFGGGAAYSSEVTLDMSANPATYGYLVRISGRTDATTGLQQSNFSPPPAVSPQGNFTFSWGPWAQPFLGPCGQCFDTQSEICYTSGVPFDTSITLKSAAPYDIGNGFWTQFQVFTLGSQSTAGYNKIISCSGAWRTFSRRGDLVFQPSIYGKMVRCQFPIHHPMLAR